jgi:hypothetical protein
MDVINLYTNGFLLIFNIYFHNEEYHLLGYDAV